MIIGEIITEELEDYNANMSGGGGCKGYQAKFCEGQDKVTFANKGGRNSDEKSDKFNFQFLPFIYYFFLALLYIFWNFFIIIIII